MSLKGKTQYKGFGEVDTDVRIRSGILRWSPPPRQSETGEKRFWLTLDYQHRHENGSVFDDKRVKVPLTDEERDAIMAIFYEALERSGVVTDPVDA